MEFKAEVVRHKKAENLSLPECGRKFDVLPKLAQKVREKMDLQLHGSGYVETARSLGSVANVYLSVVR